MERVGKEENRFERLIVDKSQSSSRNTTDVVADKNVTQLYQSINWNATARAERWRKYMLLIEKQRRKPSKSKCKKFCLWLKILALACTIVSHLHVTFSLDHFWPWITNRFEREWCQLLRALKSFVGKSGTPHRGALSNNLVFSSILPLSGIFPYFCNRRIASLSWSSALRLPVCVLDFGK